MSTFLIFAVHEDEKNGQIEAVKWKKYHHGSETFTSQFRETPVIEVVDAILGGDEVFTTRSENSSVQCRRVKTIVYPGGIEGIVTDEQDGREGPTLLDLPRF